MATEYILDGIAIQILSGLIIAGIVGVGSFCMILYKCVHKQAQNVLMLSQSMLLLAELIEDQNKQNDPAYKRNVYGKIERLLKGKKDEF